MQKQSSVEKAHVCIICGRFIGSLSEQLAFLSGEPLSKFGPEHVCQSQEYHKDVCIRVIFSVHMLML